MATTFLPRLCKISATLRVVCDFRTDWHTLESNIGLRAGQGALDDVEYPGLGKVTTGRADIFFYKENYSQAAFIHVEDDEYHKMTFQIEPFLPGVKIFDEYIEFEE